MKIISHGNRYKVYTQNRGHPIEYQNKVTVLRYKCLKAEPSSPASRFKLTYGISIQRGLRVMGGSQKLFQTEPQFRFKGLQTEPNSPISQLKLTYATLKKRFKCRHVCPLTIKMKLLELIRTSIIELTSSRLKHTQATIKNIRFVSLLKSLKDNS